MLNVIGIVGSVFTVMLKVSNPIWPILSPTASLIVTGTARAPVGKNMSIAKTIKIFFTFASPFFAKS
jgi:hypothetical protein